MMYNASMSHSFSHYSLVMMTVTSFLLTPVRSFAASLPDPLSCNMGATKTTLTADGIDNARVVVTIRDE